MSTVGDKRKRTEAFSERVSATGKANATGEGAFAAAALSRAARKAARKTAALAAAGGPGDDAHWKARGGAARGAMDVAAAGEAAGEAAADATGEAAADTAGEEDQQRVKKRQRVRSAGVEPAGTAPRVAGELVLAPKQNPKRRRRRRKRKAESEGVAAAASKSPEGEHAATAAAHSTVDMVADLMQPSPGAEHGDGTVLVQACGGRYHGFDFASFASKRSAEFLEFLASTHLFGKKLESVDLSDCIVTVGSCASENGPTPAEQAAATEWKGGERLNNIARSLASSDKVFLCVQLPAERVSAAAGALCSLQLWRLDRSVRTYDAAVRLCWAHGYEDALITSVALMLPDGSRLCPLPSAFLTTRHLCASRLQQFSVTVRQ